MATGKTKTALNLRAGPSTNDEVLTILDAFVPLEIVSQQGDWLKVTANGRSGFVHSDFVTIDQPPADSPSADTPTRTGRTIDILNLRSGPSINHPILKELPFDTAVTILETEGTWFKVNATGTQGFVHSGFIQLDSEKVDGGFIDKDGGSEQPPLENTPHSPDESEKIVITSAMNNSEKFVARTWNEFGGLFAALSSRLGIDPGVAVAVFVAESGGQGFINGRMVIRFENHIFWRKWGQNNQAKFDQHFIFDSRMIWMGHQWRANPTDEFQNFHGNQNREWQVFTFARSLNELAAKLSISMGGPQIMGFNHHAVGFESVHQMFDSFSENEANQIIGFFDFVKGPASDVRKIMALKRLDFETFASLYNGPGQASRYASIIQALFDTYTRLRNN